MGEFSKILSSPPLATILAPENCRYHAVSKVMGLRILWPSRLTGVQPVSAVLDVRVPSVCLSGGPDTGVLYKKAKRGAPGGLLPV